MSEEGKSVNGLPARLTVLHPPEGDYRSRSIYVSLDGEKFATLPSGRSITREIEPGPHRLLADNTFRPKTVEFDVQPGEQVYYTTWNRAGFGSWMAMIFGAGPLYLVLERLGGKPTATDMEKVRRNISQVGRRSEPS